MCLWSRAQNSGNKGRVLGERAKATANTQVGAFVEPSLLWGCLVFGLFGYLPTQPPGGYWSSLIVWLDTVVKKIGPKRFELFVLADYMAETGDHALASMRLERPPTYGNPQDESLIAPTTDNFSSTDAIANVLECPRLDPACRLQLQNRLDMEMGEAQAGKLV